jgi:hypothetical protein
MIPVPTAHSSEGMRIPKTLVLITGPLIVLMYPGAAQVQDVEGWAGARWGMTERQVLQTFTGKAKRLRGPEGGRTYPAWPSGARVAEVGIDSALVGGVALDAQFLFDPARGLDGIVLKPAWGRSTDASFQSVERALELEYGRPPDRRASQDGDLIESVWRSPTTHVELVLIDTPAPAASFLTLTFTPSRIPHRQSTPGRLSPVLGTHFPNYSFKMTGPVESDGLSIDNAWGAISFKIYRALIAFSLQNKGTEPIRIDWDKVSFVNPDGVASRVMHSGVRFIERDRPQPPTIVPPGARITDELLPTNRVQYGRGWDVVPLLPTKGHAVCGESFSVFMPLEVGHREENNSFVFRIDCGGPQTQPEPRKERAHPLQPSAAPTPAAPKPVERHPADTQVITLPG